MSDSQSSQWHSVVPNIADPDLAPIGRQEFCQNNAPSATSRYEAANQPGEAGAANSSAANSSGAYTGGKSFFQEHRLMIVISVVVLLILMVIIYVYLTRKGGEKKKGDAPPGLPPGAPPGAAPGAAPSLAPGSAPGSAPGPAPGSAPPGHNPYAQSPEDIQKIRQIQALRKQRMAAKHQQEPRPGAQVRFKDDPIQIIEEEVAYDESKNIIESAEEQDSAPQASQEPAQNQPKETNKKGPLPVNTPITEELDSELHSDTVAV